MTMKWIGEFFFLHPSLPILRSPSTMFFFNNSGTVLYYIIKNICCISGCVHLFKFSHSKRTANCLYALNCHELSGDCQLNEPFNWPKERVPAVDCNLRLIVSPKSSPIHGSQRTEHGSPLPIGRVDPRRR